jgi:pyruvate-ferredoxin/flavodoxin oxidoreductase
MFFGLGSDGTVGANKNSIKIIGEGTDSQVQGYFVYDSKKAGAITVSHLRFGPKAIRAPYLVQQADFVACHQFGFLERYDMLSSAKPGSVFLLNSPIAKDQVWDELPKEVQEQVISKKLRFYVIDGSQVARDAGMGNRINTVMQTCFFAISGVLPKDEAITKIKEAIQKTYGKKGADVVAKNHGAVDAALAHLHQVPVPAQATSKLKMPPVVSPEAPEFVQNVTAVMIAAKGDSLPVSAFPPDGTWPLGTTQWEKRNIAEFIPVWDEKICIQCNKCVMVCPHAAIRAKVYDPALLEKAPKTFKALDFKGQPFKGQKYTIQIAPEDCTGCEMCAVICPAKDKANPSHKSLTMAEQRPLREPERENYAFFLDLPEVDRTKLKLDVKGTAFMQPLFEYSGACAGCGETPYVKLLTQLFGDRALIGNATGCSSIYGGNLPTTPYTTNKDGRGPSWSNSLFEDNAEFSFGFRLAVDAQMAQAKLYVQQFASKLGDELVKGLLEADQGGEEGIAAQRERVGALVEKLKGDSSNDARRLIRLASFLVKKSVWAVGGDGWAYDIGFGGLDHVLASDRDINVLVLDTGVYSNTGGQQSKATPLGAAAKFAAAGREVPRKDLGMIAMAYPNCYVAQVAFGAKDLQTVKAFVEADLHPGPSVIIAYSHCIAHGFDLKAGCEHQKLAVEAGLWPLYRSDPARAAKGEPPLQLDAGGEIKRPVKDFTMTETRFRMVQKLYPARFDRLQVEAQNDASRRVQLYRQLAEVRVKPPGEDAG